jgi:hypothetical protein
MEKELRTIWDALHGYREDCVSTDDESWDEICGAMANITESLGLDPSNPELTN